MSWIDTVLATLHQGLIRERTKVDRAYRRSVSALAVRLKFAFCPLRVLGAIACQDPSIVMHLESPATHRSPPGPKGSEGSGGRVREAPALSPALAPLRRKTTPCERSRGGVLFGEGTPVQVFDS